MTQRSPKALSRHKWPMPPNPKWCPCVVAEKPKCGRTDCWHFGFNKSDCDLCHQTGFVND